jgi:hypothetical protein
MALSHDNNDYDCYIRRKGPTGWTRSRPHHREALLRFLDLSRSSENSEISISVSHVDGGDFVAWFRRVNPVICQFRDESGSIVDIMMSSSGTAAFANRIVDHC